MVGYSAPKSITVPGLDEVSIQCPYCGETIQVFIEASSDPQEYYEDCTVCCAPIFFFITLSDDNALHIVIKRGDE